MEKNLQKKENKFIKFFKNIFQKITNYFSKDNAINRKNLSNKLKKKFFGTKGVDGILMKIVVYALLIIIGFIYIYPLLYMLVTSLKSESDLMDSSIVWLPTSLEFSNYKVAFGELNYITTFFKTIVVVLVPSVINTVVALLTAYGFSRFKFPGRKFFFGLMLATFIIPSVLTKIPQFVWYNKMGLIGSILTYILPSSFGQGLNEAIYILILFSMFNLIPKQLEEAARIDGATNLGVFFKVAIPMVIPGIITVFLFSFVWYWNDSATAAMYLGRAGQDYWATIPVMLERYQASIVALTNGGIGMKLYQGKKMAGTLLSIIPLLILYFALQKYFVESVEKTGIAGE